jgi:hypothetical protein
MEDFHRLLWMCEIIHGSSGGGIGLEIMGFGGASSEFGGGHGGRRHYMHGDDADCPLGRGW